MPGINPFVGRAIVAFYQARSMNTLTEQDKINETAQYFKVVDVSHSYFSNLAACSLPDSQLREFVEHTIPVMARFVLQINADHRVAFYEYLVKISDISQMSTET